MTVVFTCLDSIEQLPAACWMKGDQESYEATKRIAENLYGNDRILLVGRQDKLGNTEPLYAVAAQWNGWRRVSNMHVRLALHFLSGSDDSSALKAARMLVEFDCGGAVGGETDRDLHNAVSRLQSCLRALGVDRGDESYVQIAAACGRPALSAKA